MIESAAHLVDNILPLTPYRQFVLSFPIPMRYWFQTNRKLFSKVHGILNSEVSLARWATWKRQLSFGGFQEAGGYNPTRDDLPQVYSETSHSVNTLLYFVVAHEIGHILDGTNSLNGGPWLNLSWQRLSERELTPLFDSQFRSNLFFSSCESGFISRDNVRAAYDGLFGKSNFISLYGSRHPADDFAESLAYFVMHEYLQASYLIDTKAGQTFDVMQRLLSPAFSSKYNFIRDFLASPDVIYPRGMVPN